MTAAAPEAGLPDPADAHAAPAWLDRFNTLAAETRLETARDLARRFAKAHGGPARDLLLAALVSAYTDAGETLQARRLQRWLVRRHPGIETLEQDYIGLLALTDRAGDAYRRLERNALPRAAGGRWRELERQLPPALILGGLTEEAFALSAALVAEGERDWTTLATLAWSAGALDRLPEALARVEDAPPVFEDDEDEELAYRFVRLCAAYGGEGRAVRWLLTSDTAQAFAWTPPYRRRAGLPDAATPARDRVLAHVAAAPLFPTVASTGVDLVCDFPNAVGGAEEHLLDLAALLADAGADVAVWSLLRLHPAYVARGVRLLAPGAPRSRGRVLCIVGGWHGEGDWIERFAPSRVLLFLNTLNTPQALRLIEALGRRTGCKVELAHASDLVRRESALPGVVEISPIDPARTTAPRAVQAGALVIGRHSRDTFDKHHAADPHVYRALLARDLRVRVLGGTVLRARMAPHPALDLLPVEPRGAPAFLATLDIFFYRTGAWTEPCARAIFEAMREGIPVVVGDVGGHVEFIRNGIDGFVVRSTEEALERLLQLAEDAELRAEMGAAGRERFLTFYGAEARAAVVRRYLGQET